MSYERLMGVAFKGTAIAGVAGLAAWFLRRRSASARHLVWTAAVGALVALPLLSISIPAWRVRGAAAVDPGVVFRVFSRADGPSEVGLSAGQDVGVPGRPGGLPHKTGVDPRLALAGIW